MLSAGHDGKLFLWNIITGEILVSFQNTIDGQGFGAVFDAKWSSDGNTFAATDSHGQILTYGFGMPDVTRKVNFQCIYAIITYKQQHLITWITYEYYALG